MNAEVTYMRKRADTAEALLGSNSNDAQEFMTRVVAHAQSMIATHAHALMRGVIDATEFTARMQGTIRQTARTLSNEEYHDISSGAALADADEHSLYLRVFPSSR